MIISEENEKLTDLIKNLPPTTTNTLNNNQQYDINIFLNDTCKDAINISDFVKTLMIGMDELEIARNQGMMEGVSSIFVNGLNKLEGNTGMILNKLHPCQDYHISE